MFYFTLHSKHFIYGYLVTKIITNNIDVNNCCKLAVIFQAILYSQYMKNNNLCKTCSV